LQWEAESFGTNFNGLGKAQSIDWIGITPDGLPITEMTLATGDFGNAVHWRARLIYNPASLPFQPYSRWITSPINGWNELDLRTGSISTIWTIY
jgi:hypothetical protein